MFSVICNSDKILTTLCVSVTLPCAPTYIKT